VLRPLNLVVRRKSVAGDDTPTSRPRKTSPIVSPAIAAITCLAFVAPLPPSRPMWEGGSEKWNDAWGRRRRIANWLVWTHSLIGNTRREVTERLEEPEPTETFGDNVLTYNLGAAGHYWHPNANWLVLKLDQSGRVIAASVERD
jgi:hypothetical protein